MDDQQVTQEAKAAATPRLLNPWVQLIIGISVVLGGIWAAVQFFNPLKDLDVTVIIDNKTEFSLPEQASSLQKLTLTYDGKPIKRISLLRLTVVNTGRRAIEPPKDSLTNDWVLTIRSWNKTPLVQVGELARRPDFLSVKAETGPEPDAVHLRLRVLNRNESVTMQVALIGDQAFFIKAETPEPRVRDLNVAVAENSVRNRIQETFTVPLWAASIVGFLALWINDIRRGREPAFANHPSAAKVAGTVIGGLLMLLFGSALVAVVTSWLLAWIVYFVALR